MENQRTESLPLGRGNVRCSTWDLAKADADTPRYDFRNIVGGRNQFQSEY
jgi:hypothetical protein